MHLIRSLCFVSIFIAGIIAANGAPSNLELEDENGVNFGLDESETNYAASKEKSEAQAEEAARKPPKISECKTDEDCPPEMRCSFLVTDMSDGRCTPHTKPRGPDETCSSDVKPPCYTGYKCKKSRNGVSSCQP